MSISCVNNRYYRPDCEKVPLYDAILIDRGSSESQLLERLMELRQRPPSQWSPGLQMDIRCSLTAAVKDALIDLFEHCQQSVTADDNKEKTRRWELFRLDHLDSTTIDVLNHPSIDLFRGVSISARGARLPRTLIPTLRKVFTTTNVEELSMSGCFFQADDLKCLREILSISDGLETLKLRDWGISSRNRGTDNENTDNKVGFIIEGLRKSRLKVLDFQVAPDDPNLGVQMIEALRDNRHVRRLDIFLPLQQQDSRQIIDAVRSNVLLSSNCFVDHLNLFNTFSYAPPLSLGGDFWRALAESSDIHRFRLQWKATISPSDMAFITKLITSPTKSLRSLELDISVMDFLNVMKWEDCASPAMQGIQSICTPIYEPNSVEQYRSILSTLLSIVENGNMRLKQPNVHPCWVYVLRAPPRQSAQNRCPPADIQTLERCFDRQLQCNYMGYNLLKKIDVFSSTANPGLWPVVLERGAMAKGENVVPYDGLFCTILKLVNVGVIGPSYASNTTNNGKRGISAEKDSDRSASKHLRIE